MDLRTWQGMEGSTPVGCSASVTDGSKMSWNSGMSSPEKHTLEGRSGICRIKLLHLLIRHKTIIDFQEKHRAMSKLQHCTLSLEGTLYSLDRKRKYSFKSAATLDNGRAIVCLRNINDGKIAGYIKFDASPDEKDELADTLLLKLNDVLALKGLVLEMRKEPELHWITPEGKAMKRVTAIYNMAYSIDVSIEVIHAETLTQADELFNRINSEQELSKMANTIRKIHKLPTDTGNFLIHWVQFNKKYNQLSQTHGCERNEWERIKCYMGSFNDTQIAVVHDRNRTLFDLLAKSNIINKIRQVNESHELELAINKKNKTEIVVQAVSCAYALRNDLAHELVFEFSDHPKLINFVRDLIYLELVANNKGLVLGKTRDSMRN